MKGLRILTWIILGAAWAAGAWAGDLRGRVVDADGAPLPGATVVLRDAASGQQRYGTAAGADGRFELADVGAGRYQLVASFVGYAPHEELLTIPADGPVRRELVLAARALPQDEVVVAAARARQRLHPVTFSNVTAADLERLPDMKDVPVLLSSLPSTTYYSENGNGIGYSYLRLRGFDQRRVAVSINGIPQNDPEDHNVFWINFFDLQGAIQDVQVQRGAGAALYGSTGIGGAINIVASPYRPAPYATAEVGYGGFETRRFTVQANSGLLGGRYVAYGRLSRLLSDGYRDWAWTEFWRFFGGVTRYGERSTLTLQAFGGPQRDGLAYIGIPKDANDAPVDDGFGGEIDRRYNYSGVTGDIEQFHQPQVQLFHDLRLRPNLTLHQTLFWAKGEGYFDFDGTFRSPDYLRLPEGWRGVAPADRGQPLFALAPEAALLFRAYLDQWQVGWLPRATWANGLGETTLGAEARLHRSLRWGRIQEAPALPEELVGGDDDVRVYSFRGEKVIGSVYGSHLARPAEAVAVQADLQLTYRHYRQYDEAFIGTSFRVPYVFANPRLGVTLFPEQPFSVYGSVAYASREPRLKALYDGEEAGAGFEPRFARDADGGFDVDAPFVEPEHLVDVELGASFAAPRYRVGATGYWMDFRDEIVPSGGLDQFGTPRTGNADRTRHVGLELEGAVRLLPGLDVEANATLSRNRFVTFTEYGFDGTPLVRDGNVIAGFPERVANLLVSYARSGFSASLDAKYAGEQFVDNSGGEDPGYVVDPYTLVNASVGYAFGGALDGLALSLDVNNVLDRRVLLYGNAGFGSPQFFPAATRHLFVGARYTLR